MEGVASNSDTILHPLVFGFIHYAVSNHDKSETPCFN